MKFRKAYSFDDLLMVDKFSTIASRKDGVDPSVMFLGYKLATPIISSNMACVTSANMAHVMVKTGGMGALHRFMDIDTNMAMFHKSPTATIVSGGVGDSEISRLVSLYERGATRLLIDVAQGANSNVIETTRKLREKVKNNAAIIVGNFSNGNALRTFLHKLPCHIDAVKIGIGGGSACITRKITGCGIPTLASIFDCHSVGLPIIADGGIRDSGDFAKAIAAGASAVMCGRLFAACSESLAESREVEVKEPEGYKYKVQRKYSGSASADSYEAQGKTAEHRTPEGESYWVDATGSAADVIQKFNAGLRSAMSYNNATTVTDLQDNVEWVEVTSAGAIESGPHGKY